MTAFQKEQIAYLRGKGESYAKIAAALGISENTVKSFCRRNGLGGAAADDMSAETKPVRSRTSEMEIGKTTYTVTTTFNENAKETVEQKLIRYVADRISGDV